MSRVRSICGRLASIGGLVLLGLLLSASGAQALSPVTPNPGWVIRSVAQPTNFTPSDATGHDTYLVTATNDGGAPTDGSSITITDVLPPKMPFNAAVGASITDPGGNTVSPCTSSTNPTTHQTTVTCTDADDKARIAPGQSISVVVPVEVPALSDVPDPNGSVTNSVQVQGGGSTNNAAVSCPDLAQGSPPFRICASAAPSNTISTSQAGFGIQTFDGWITNADGATDEAAGSHPYEATTGFAITSTFDSLFRAIPAGGVKDITVNLPPGLVGDPSATPDKCTQQELVAGFASNCPLDAQVGLVKLDLTGNPGYEPVYNMVPPPGMPAQFGFRVLTTAVFVDTAVRTGGDYGLTAIIRNAPQGFSLLGSWLTFWGVPGDPSHDIQRCQDSGLVTNGACSPADAASWPAGAQIKPFLTLPTSCQGPQTTTIAMDSWESGAVQSSSFVSHDTTGAQVGATQCDQVPFNPTISAQPDTLVADSPTGFNVDVHVPQKTVYSDTTDTDAYTSIAEANLKDTIVTLPVGMSVSPSAADGLGACAPSQINLGDASQPSCPDSSKVGSVEVDTPLLPTTPLTGAVYLAQPKSNPFGTELALYLVAQGDGVIVKLAGKVTADPSNGQLVTTFDGNPQLPFSDFKLHFFNGRRAALMTPEACSSAPYTITSSMTPWSGQPSVSATDQFTINGPNAGCVSGFAPTFTAGVTNPLAGASSPFVLSFSRSDTDQELSGLTVSLPPGLLAKIAGVPLCSDAQAGVGQCPASSQVGTVEAAAGPGKSPFFLPGTAYLTGPYSSPATGQSGPYGLVVEVPAVAGPFNLGMVVVRQVIQIDPTDAHVTVISDPFPTILTVPDAAGMEGFPLRVRTIDVSLDRPGFMVNPTSCNPMQISATFTAVNQATAAMGSRFQVGGCQQLAFSPKLRIALTGKGKTRSGDHPTLNATLSAPAGANIASARVTLPLSLALDPLNSQHVCSYDVAQAVHGGAVGCPANTIVGTATAVTPLLPQPETGKVYLVQGIRFNSQGQRIRTLPSLLIPLRGQVALDLRAQSSVDHGRLVNTFTSVPDVPVSSFLLSITGGPRGLLVITGRGQSICNAPQIASGVFGAQNGKTKAFSLQLATPCGAVKAAHKTKHKHKHKRTHHGKH